MTVKEILETEGLTIEQRIGLLKEKTVYVPTWRGDKGLSAEYDPRQHPVMNKAIYQDEVTDEGIKPVTRISLGFQKLATKRMTELVTGIPVKRVYKPENDRQKEVAKFLEAIYDRNRINSVNVERMNMLFAGCEVITLWYAVEQPNTLYAGVQSRLKLRCRNFSPMLGDELYPLFDEYGDLIALSIGYSRKVGRRKQLYFDTYTADRHLKFSNATGQWAVEEDEMTTVGKIPAIYVFRPTPIWEQQSTNVFEMEWALSRNGNYLRKNSKPRFCVFADEVINYGDEKDQDKEFMAVMQYPKGSTAEYVTWQQATETLKFHIDALRNLFFTQLQLPDWSYEKMSQQAMSGESRKQLFIDAQLKVKDESGPILEFFERETNVLKAFAKIILGSSYEKDIDALPVESVITPFTITDEKERVDVLTSANGGKAIMSQRESIEEYGKSEDVDKTLQEIAEQDKADVFSLTE